MSFYLKCSFQKSKSIRNSFMIFTLNLLLQNHLAKFKRSKFPTIAKHKYFNKKISHIYNFNCFRISISLGNKVNYSSTCTSLSAKFSNTGGQREEDIGHHVLLQFDTLWTQSNATITVFNCHKTFATEKVRKGGLNTQTRHCCPACLQEKEGSSNKNNTAQRKISLITHFTSCCPMTSTVTKAFCTCAWSLKIVSWFYMVLHKTPPQKKPNKTRKEKR